MGFYSQCTAGLVSAHQRQAFLAQNTLSPFFCLKKILFLVSVESHICIADLPAYSMSPAAGTLGACRTRYRELRRRQDANTEAGSARPDPTRRPRAGGARLRRHRRLLGDHSGPSFGLAFLFFYTKIPVLAILVTESSSSKLKIPRCMLICREHSRIGVGTIYRACARTAHTRGGEDTHPRPVQCWALTSLHVLHQEDGGQQAPPQGWEGQGPALSAGRLSGLL